MGRAPNNGTEGTKTVRQRPVRNSAGRRDTLMVEGKDPNFEYRIVNDTPGRVAEMKAMGYELADGDERFNSSLDDSKSESSVKSKHVGGGVNGVLMRIPKDWYDEYQKEKAEHVDKLERKTKSMPTDIKGGYGKVEIN